MVGVAQCRRNVGLRADQHRQFDGAAAENGVQRTDATAELGTACQGGTTPACCALNLCATATSRCNHGKASPRRATPAVITRVTIGPIRTRSE